MMPDENGDLHEISTSTFDVDSNQPIKDEFDDTSVIDGLIAQEVKSAMDSLGVNFSGWSEDT